MSSSPTEIRQTVDAGTILSATLKLLGIYLLYTTILQSAPLMNAMFSIANVSQLRAEQLGQLVTSISGTILSIGFAIVLIRHGGRAAHWLAVTVDEQVPIVNPTQKWYRSSLLFTGIWVLATQFPISLSMLAWVISQTFYPLDNAGSAATASLFTISAIHGPAVLAMGLGLVFGARPIGDWLYRLSGADRATATTAETQ